MELEGCYSVISNWCILIETPKILKLELSISENLNPLIIVKFLKIVIIIFFLKRFVHKL